MSSKRKRRVPQCARCRSHNTFASVRGHKKQCQWKDCTCAKCLMVAEKRRVTAVRVAVLRRERKRRTTQRMRLNAEFPLGMSGNHTWGMTGQSTRAYAVDHFVENRRMSVPSNPFFSEMVHMAYPGMHPYQNNHHLYAREFLGRQEQAPNTTHAAISHNVESFDREYESLMRKLNETNAERGLSPSNQIEMMTSSRSSPSSKGFGPDSVSITSTVTPLCLNTPPVKCHGNFCQPRLPQDRQRFFPMMLNGPLTLPYPCPGKTGDIQYGLYM